MPWKLTYQSFIDTLEAAKSWVQLFIAWDHQKLSIHELHVLFKATIRTNRASGHSLTEVVIKVGEISDAMLPTRWIKQHVT